MRKLIIAALFCTIAITNAFSQEQTAAENVAQTVSVGFSMVSTQGVLSNDIPSLNVRYFFDSNVAAELFAGFSTGDTEDSFIIGGKAIALIQSFKNLNVYAAVTGACGALKYGNRGATNGFFKVAAGAGIEYFILNNLSISAEAGIGFFDAANISRQFGVYADWLPQVGLRYYL